MQKPNQKRIVINKKQSKPDRTASRLEAVKYREIDPMRDTQTYISKGLSAVFSHYPDIKNYGTILFDPFKTESATIPHYPILPSYALRVRSTGRGQCNSLGIGWVTCSNMGPVASDLSQIVVTNGPNASSLVSFPGGTDCDNVAVASPYTTADFKSNTVVTNSQFRVRLVALGIRTKFFGKVLNKAGVTRSFWVPYPGASVLDSSFTDAGKIPYKESQFGYEWHSVTYLPHNDSDFEYVGYDGDTSTWTYANTVGTSTQVQYQGAFPQMAVMMSGDSGAPFEWEVVGHYELVGYALPNRTTKMDMAASVKKLVSAGKSVRHMDSTTPSHNVGKGEGSLVSLIGKGLSKLLPENLSSVIQTVGSVASKVLPFLL